MNTRGFRGLACAACVVALAVSTGCPKKEAEPEAAEVVAQAEPPPEPVAQVEDAADDAEEAEPTPAAEKADEETGSEPDADPADPAGADDEAEPAAQEGGDAEPEAEPAGPDPKAMLATAVNRRTKDDDARKLLAEAEAAGASVRDVAKAAVDRGLQLHATPDRAAAFFEWAAEKDPKYPDPIWHLARQAVVEGDVTRSKELLGTVNERGGKKLLQQIDFDPMWEIVKDDPDVRKLL